MLDVLKAEDTLQKALREALDAGISKKSLDHHISLSIREQLLGETLQPFDIPKSPGHQISIAAEVTLPNTDSNSKLRVLPDFEPQRKSKRHVSYGLR